VRPTIIGALLLCIARSISAQSEIVRGHISDAKQAPVGDVHILLTGVVSHEVYAATTNREGNFTILVTDGEGAYSISARRIGFSPVTRLVTVGSARSASVDITLREQPFSLEPLTTSTTPSTQDRLPRPKPGSVERDAWANRALLLDPGSFDALLSILPGATMTDSGASFLGAPASQNHTLVNGLGFDGRGLPQDAIGSARMTTSTGPSSR
jgi:hypothetical protein